MGNNEIIKSNQREENNINFFKSLIPQKISNGTTLSFFDFLRKISFHNFPNNLQKNTQNFKNHTEQISSNNGYIEDQSNYIDMYYGNKTISFCGCEIIAVYNAFYDLTGKHDISFPQMINDFEKDGIVLSGFFGTAPKAIDDYFKKKGFKTLCSSKKEEYDEIAERTDAIIFTLYNDKYDIFNMVHTMNITKKNNKYFVHNNGYNSFLEPYDSISDLLSRINNGNSKDIFLIGIFKN